MKLLLILVQIIELFHQQFELLLLRSRVAKLCIHHAQCGAKLVSPLAGIFGSFLYRGEGMVNCCGLVWVVVGVAIEGPLTSICMICSVRA